MGKVLLGMPGPWANDNREPSDPYTCKIGGLPDWPLPKNAINPQFLHCASCGSQLCLVAQVYAPISIRIQHRFLFIFACQTPTCGTTSQSWRVLRIQKIHDVDDDNSQQTCVHDDDDDDDGASVGAASSSSEVRNANVLEEDLNDVEDEGDVDFGELSKGLFSATTFASSPDTSSSKKKKPRKKRQQHDLLPATPLDSDTPVVPCFYVYTQEEPASEDLSSVCSSYSSLSIKENENNVGVEDHPETEETWEKEQYEYDKALTADRIYLKFKKRLDAYPEQCFRYSYGGKPILAAAAEIDPGRCRYCDSPRLFEMQLMPPLLYFLQEALDEDQRQIIENWEWMTLIVFTCSENCYEKIEQVKSDNNGWIVAEEVVVAQYEESMPNQLSFFS